MKRKAKMVICTILTTCLLGTVGCVAETTNQPKANDASKYTLEQAMSEKAQLSTIAFSGLAFITGTSGADTFFPPGKVADFFGFQYMRDIDENGHGHNTNFLTTVASNVLYILNDEQKAQLTALAKEQEQLYLDFGYGRYPLMTAFRENMEGNIPSGSTGLSLDGVKQYTAKLYELDAQLSYRRAEVVGAIVNSFTAEQRAYLEKMSFNNSATWPNVAEDETLKKSMNNNQFVAVMTYASELFSWYKGSLDADTYFCPERHGTYFGGFYMKDYPAMGNADYFISTALTGDSGQALLDTLTPAQREKITSIISLQTADLKEIADIRLTISQSLRKFMQGETADKSAIFTLIKRYGELDGEMSYYYASRFAEVAKTLTTEQKAKLVEIRNQNVFPETGNGYLFSTPIKLPSEINTNFLFGIGTLDSVVVIPSTEKVNQQQNNKQPQNKDKKNEKALTDEQKVQVKTILLKYSAATITAEDAKAIKRAFKDAGINNGASLDTAIAEAGFDAQKLEQLAPPPDKNDQNKKSIMVKVKGKNVVFDVPPVLKNDRTLIPVRAVSTALGATVGWNENTNTVTITKDGFVITLVIGSDIANVNGVENKLDAPAEVISNRTFVPLRFISEAFNQKVDWQEDTQTVVIE